MVNRSGRRPGSSSSSQSIGAETGAPGAGRGLYGRDQRLVDRVLGVVEPGQPAAVADLPLPADQLGHHRADRPGQLLDPGAGLVEGRPGAIGTQIWMPRRPVTFGRATHAEVLERGAVQPGQREQVLPAGRRRRGRGRSARTSAGAAGRSARSRRATRARRSSPPRPARRARRPPDRSGSRPGRRPGCPSGAASPARGSGSSLCQKPLVPRAVREPVHVQRAAASGTAAAIGRDLRGVPQQLALGHRRLARRGREEHLVEVGHPQLAAEDRPRAGRCRARPARASSSSARGCDAAASSATAARAAGRSERHSRSGSALTSSLVRPLSTDAGWSSGVPAVHGVLVVLVQQQPLLLAGRRSAVRTSTNRPRSFSPYRSTCSSPSSTAARIDRVAGLVRLPGAGVPDDDVAAAVLAGRDDALEVEVLQRVVLDVERRPAHVGSRVGPFGTAQLTSTPSISSRKS